VRHCLLQPRVALLVVLIAASPGLARAQAPASPPADLAAALQKYNEGARFPLPELDSGNLRRLGRGQVVRIRDEVNPDGGPQRITGLLLCDARRDDLWVAFRDMHLVSLPELTEVRISPDGQWPTQWYQFFHMPGPFADRHWVIDVNDNLELASSSGDGLWEHYWSLSKDGPKLVAQVVSAERVPRVTPAAAEEAIYVPVNEGAWLLISLADGRTVLGYTVRASVGGRIPDRLVVSYSMMTLARMLRRVLSRSALVSGHYGAEHPRIRGGGGQPIP